MILIFQNPPRADLARLLHTVQHSPWKLLEKINISEMCDSTQPPDNRLTALRRESTQTLTKKADESGTSIDFTEEVEWSTRKFLLGCLTEQAHQVQADAWEATQGCSFRPPRTATWFRRFLGERKKRFVHSVWLVPVPHPARGPETAHTYHGAILLTSPGTEDTRE